MSDCKSVCCHETVCGSHLTVFCLGLENLFCVEPFKL